MFINCQFSYWEMSPEFQAAEMQHMDNLPPSFDEAIYFDCMMLFMGL